MKKLVNYFIKSNTIGFSHYKKEDAEMIATWINNPETNNYFVHFLPHTKEKMEKVIENLSKSNSEVGFVSYDIKGHRPFGILEIRNIDFISKKCTLEIAIGSKKYRGKGYGSKMMLLAEKYIFKTLKLNKCRLHTCTENKSMINLAKKMGYHAEGILKDELFIDGKNYDEVIFSKIIKKTSGKSLSHISSSVLDLIGNTPVVEFKKINPFSNIRLFGKLEFFNPSGSVKDRAALEMIEDALAKGIINKNTTIVECTSGNTGIGLAMVCAVKGMRCILVAPKKVIPLGKRSIMQALGAKLIETSLEGDYELSIKKAKEIAKSIPNAFMPHQFENEANSKVHEKTTAIEIIKDFGSDIDVVVSAVGSGGTITGVGRILKSFNPNIKMVAVEPENCAALSNGKIGVHYILGIGAGFIPKIIDRKVIDFVETVTDEEAAEYCMKLSREEGIFCGISSGAALCGALKYAKKQKKSMNILVFIPDNGVRYVGKKGFFMDFFDKYVENNQKVTEI